MNKTFEYKGTKVIVGKSPMYNLWRLSIDGCQIPNTFLKNEQSAINHAKQLIDAQEGK